MSPWSLRLTKAVLPDDFARRRRQLLNHMQPGSIAVIPGAVQHRRNNDIFFPFRQNSDFYYLTGFCEPDALLVLIPRRCLLYTSPSPRDS